MSTSRSYRSALKVLAFTGTQLVWAISAGLPERPQTADLGMGDGAKIYTSCFWRRRRRRSGGFCFSPAEGAQHPVSPTPRGCSARWMLAGRAPFCPCLRPPEPAVQSYSHVRKGNRLLLSSVFLFLLQAWMVCGIVSAVL